MSTIYRRGPRPGRIARRTLGAMENDDEAQRPTHFWQNPWVVALVSGALLIPVALFVSWVVTRDGGAEVPATEVPTLGGVASSEDFRVRLITVDCPVAVPGDERRGKLCAASVKLMNRSKEASNPTIGWKLVSGDLKYPSINSSLLSLTQVFPGEEVDVTVSFNIPDEAAPTGLEADFFDDRSPLRWEF